MLIGDNEYLINWLPSNRSVLIRLSFCTCATKMMLMMKYMY